MKTTNLNSDNCEPFKVNNSYRFGLNWTVVAIQVIVLYSDIAIIDARADNSVCTILPSKIK